MPTSSNELIPHVLDNLMELRPASILDIGVGFGKVGFLAREYLEVWGSRCYQKADWRTRIYGIEVFPDYKNPNWDFAYDEVFIGNAEELLDRMEPVDVITFLDVIEHFEKEAGARLLDKCLSKARHVMLSSPLEFHQQGAVFGNAHEIHRSLWGESDFRDYNYIIQPLSLVFVARLWNRAPGEPVHQERVSRLAVASGYELAAELAARILRRIGLKPRPGTARRQQ
jgi:hypothetical protein